MQKICVYPGSFDPITMGHYDIIKTASVLFDKVIVLVARNQEKNYFFDVEQRVGLIKKTVKGISNVSVDSFDGLLVDYVKNVNANVIIKGLRAVSDFEYEFQMALVNKKLYDSAQTIFIPASQENLYLSSSVVKQIGVCGGDISSLVPADVLDEIKQKLNKNEKDGKK